jgi:hypothetical protein
VRICLVWSQHVRLASSMLVVACVACGRARAQDANGGLSDPLAVIAAACRDNTERIGTLQLSGTVVLTGRRFAGMRDPFSGQTYDSQNRFFSVWRDGVGDARLDVTADRETDGRTTEVRYNVPYGEHITSCSKLAREGGSAEVERRYGTPQTTRRMILTPSASYRYEPERNQVYVDDPGLTALEEQPEMQLALNRMPDAGTAAELLERWAAVADSSGRSATLTDLGGGQYHIRLRIDTSGAEGRGISQTRDVVVDLERGGNIVSYAAQTDGDLVETGQFDYVNVGGAWVVAHAEIVGGIGADGVPTVRAVYDVQPKSIRINQPIDAHVFSFAGLDVRRGALVRDYTTDEQYLYDDVPIHIKIALAAEREREEEAEAGAAQQGMEEGDLRQAVPRNAPVEAENPAPSAPQRAETGKAGASSYVLLAPEGGRVQEPSTRPSAATPVIVEQRKVAEQKVPHEAPAPRPPGVTRPTRSGVVTVVAVSAGCAAALAIGIWKTTRPRS